MLPQGCVWHAYHGYIRKKRRVRLQFSGDELVLALVSLVRATNPAMLRQSAEGFTVDFESLDQKSLLADEERLLFKFRAALESRSTETPQALELDSAQCRRLMETLERLESLRPWPSDVLVMSAQIRTRLLAASGGGPTQG